MAGGRPTVMTDEVVNKLEEAFLLGCSDVEACLVANISKQTLYDYQKLNPEFVDRKERLKANPIYLARKSVLSAMPDNGELSLKFLERKAKDEFGLKQTVDTQFLGADGKPADAKIEIAFVKTPAAE